VLAWYSKEDNIR
jgi:hypothetical protein